MESQFRCGKCAKPVPSKFSKCLDCGSLGPHTFLGSVGSAVEGGPPVTPSPHRRDSYPSERIDRPAPPPSRQERYSASEPADAPEPVRSQPSRDFEDDSRFPAGMRPRSPILDYVENIDEGSEKQSRKSSSRERDFDSSDTYENSGSDSGYDDDSEEKPAASSSGSMVTLIVSVTLILILIVAGLYVFNNFDSITRWLASPTVPEFIKPSN